MTPPLIKTHHLSKHFGAKKALDEVTLCVAKGDVVGLIGPNGAGKSTLIKLITGLLRPTSGSVEVGGYDVHSDHTRAMQRLGAIIEWPNFHSDLTARQNLMIFSGAHGKAYEAKLLEITKFLEIDRQLERKVGTFSTGMKQRLGIALALLPDSEVIILDEPTNGLDPAGIVEIREIIRDFNRQYGITVVVSSHLLGEIEHICDKVALIANGRLAAAGSLAELLTEAPEIHIQVNDLPGALTLLKRQNLPLQALSPTGEQLVLKLTEKRDAEELAATVNTLLVQAGYSLTHLSVQNQDLEEFFLHKTREAQK